MQTSEFDYYLPKELIAQVPMEPRDHSRLMVVSRNNDSIKHHYFYGLLQYLRSGDVMVFNDSRVIPARVYGVHEDTGKRVELLLLSRVSDGVWRTLVRPGRWMREGSTFEISGSGTHRINGEVVEVETHGTRLVQLSNEEYLDEVGIVPLPPYIHQPLEDVERYQTVYARADGSVAAPTAGLHFTEGLLEQIQTLGVETVFVTLHVGWDSFRPVITEEVELHKMHSEYWELGQEAADIINRAKREGRRVISVGTTAVRLLEQAATRVVHGKIEIADSGHRITAGSGWADLFIYPGYRFRIVDALLTNFHLPKSTLLMLTSAFAGRERILKAYWEAADCGYRFYSFGDAMLIV